MHLRDGALPAPCFSCSEYVQLAARLAKFQHDTRTPLNAVMGYAQLLEETAAAAEDAEHAREIVKAGQKLAELLDDFAADAARSALGAPAEPAAG